MDNYLHLPMFVYKGRNKWKNTVKEWNDVELATLWHCLHHTLEDAQDVQTRMQVIYLIEKLYCITDLMKLEDLEIDDYGNQTEEED